MVVAAGSALVGRQTRQFTTYGKAIGEVSKTTKTLGQETEKAAKKVDQAGGIFRRMFTHASNLEEGVGECEHWRGEPGGRAWRLARRSEGGGRRIPADGLGSAGGGSGDRGAGRRGGALASSLARAVGGGVLLGGGLLGSFAVGIGSIATIAKPAIDATKKYETAVKNLNTATRLGQPHGDQGAPAAARRNRQGQPRGGQARAEPEVVPEGVEGGDGAGARELLQARRRRDRRRCASLLPTLSGEANKNTAALQGSFQKILAPFLQSSQFKGLITGLGGIFRANLPGVHVRAW